MKTIALIFALFTGLTAYGQSAHSSSAALEGEAVFAAAPAAVSFTLRNGSLKAIPLEIPGVMNPNLSPMSNSVVSLAVGQLIYFFDNGERELLLTVTEKLEGKTLPVHKLIRMRKKESAKRR